MFIDNKKGNRGVTGGDIRLVSNESFVSIVY